MISVRTSRLVRSRTHLATPTQNPRRRHLRDQRGGQRLADPDDAEQQLPSAAQFGVLVDRLADCPVDHLELAGEMLDRRGGQLDRGALAETAAAAILPLRPAPDDAGTHGLQFAQPPHRRRRRCPWFRFEQLGVFADQGGVDLIGLVATEFGAAEVTDLGWIDDADDVPGVVQCQRHPEAVTAGRLHADMGLFAAHSLEPSSH